MVPRRPSILCAGLLLCSKTGSVHGFLQTTSCDRVPKRQWQSIGALNNGLVDLSSEAPRDIDTMQEWAYNCGVQHHEGLHLTSYDERWFDIFAASSSEIPSGTCVMYVPANMYLTSYGAKEEFGRQEDAEKLIGNLAGADQFPLFYLFLKVLVEYERGTDSAWHPWLNSLPRTFNNGAAMTPSCYDCLPPLAAKFCMEERVKFTNCKQALKKVDFVTDATHADDELLKWIFNVVDTRMVDVGEESVIIPMADMFNHGSSGHEVEISYDEEGSCLVYTSADVPAGSPLRVSYGDYYLTNPSATFARYGFIDETCPSTFCKIMDITPSTELRDIGLSFSRMLFYKDTGEVSEEVYDVLLYQILAEKSWQEKSDFYQACMNGDAATKGAYHQQYYGETMGKLRSHVDKFLKDLDELGEKASMKDLALNPRLPLIMAHNEFVRQTFSRVKEKIDATETSYI